ncbi:MAG: PQQ-binding-like beta-propeller repeat protein [Acidobacteriota bacterium]
MQRLMILGVMALTLGTPVAHAADWGQYRGPQRDGVSMETGIEAWGDTGPKELWRRSIGPGFSTIAAVGERVYTLDSDDSKEYAVAFDRATGEELWRTEIGGLFKNDFGDGPRSGPTWHDGRIYVLSSLGDLHALDAEQGKVLWSAGFTEQFSAELPRWAFSSSPLVVDDLLIVETGGTEGRAVTAFARADGTVRWSAIDDAIAYSSPILVELHGVRQVVVLTQQGLHGLGLDGEALWHASFAPKLGITPAPPIHVAPDRFFVSASYDIGAKMVQVSKNAAGFVATDVWEARTSMRNHFNPSVLLDGHLIGFDKGTLKCIDADTGRQAWAKRGLGKGSLIRTDEHVILLSERGKLVLAAAATDAYRELASHQALTGRSWTQPTLADGRLYLRNGSEIVAYDLRGGRS